MSILPIQIPLLIQTMIDYYSQKIIRQQKLHKEYIRQLTLLLQCHNESMHEERWGLYKIAYVNADGTKVWTDDSEEVYLGQEMLNDIDRRRNEIRLEFIRKEQGLE